MSEAMHHEHPNLEVVDGEYERVAEVASQLAEEFDVVEPTIVDRASATVKTIEAAKDHNVDPATLLEGVGQINPGSVFLDAAKLARRELIMRRMGQSTAFKERARRVGQLRLLRGM